MERSGKVKGQDEMLQRISDGLIGLDDEGRFTYINERACDILECEEEDVMGENILEVFPGIEDSVFEEMHGKAMEEEKPVRFQESYGPLDSVFRVHIFPSDSGSSIYFRDVKSKEESKLERRLENLNEVITHDLRNHLNVAKGYLGLARQKGQEKDFDRVENALEEIESISESLSLITRGRNDFEMNELNLEDAFQDAEAYTSREFDYSVDDTVIEADRQSLARIIGELVSSIQENADSAVKVGAGPLKEGFYLLFEEGAGEGTRLGLVREIATLNGFDVEKVADDGTRFEFIR